MTRPPRPREALIRLAIVSGVSPPRPQQADVSVSVSGSGAGRPMVLLHGVGTNSSIWSRSIPALAEGRAVVLVDLPGFGLSPAPPEAWTIHGVASQIALALAAEVDPPYELVGSSLGGAVALALAGRHPELIHRLVLCAPAGFRPAPGPLPFAAAALAGPMLTARRSTGLRLAGVAIARRAILAGTVADGSSLDPDTARLVLRASEGATALGPAFRAAVGADLCEVAVGLPFRFGLVWGTLDRIVPAHTAERVLALRPDSVLELIPGAGHIPHLECPERFAPALERVLEQLP